MSNNNKSNIISGTGRLLFRLVLLILLVYAGYALYKEFFDRPPPLPEGRQTGIYMVEIIDGDTGVLSDGNTVRYIGIDTPEVGEPFYEDAKKLNSHFCLGKQVRIEYDHRRRDRYDRILAYIFVDDSLMINELLVEAGFANVYIFPYDQKNIQYRRRLITAQIRAIDASRGIWSLPPPEPAANYYGNSNSFRFHRPDCRTLNRSDASKMLNFESRYDFLELGFSPCRVCNP